MAGVSNAYPVSLSIDYPDRDLSKLTTLFRLITLIPIAIILGLIIGGSTQWTGGNGWKGEYAAGAFVFLPTVLTLLFRQKYPRCLLITPHLSGSAIRISGR